MISEFQGQWRWLSNFWPATVQFDGLIYPSVEHAYQAAKSLDPEVRKHISTLSSPYHAKREARSLVLTPDWETRKFIVMHRCVLSKFTRSEALRKALVATGETELQEGNNWGDREWGISPVGSGKGQNALGKILMEVRRQLK